MNKKMRHIDFSFGASLRNAREKRNYRREQIAERAEISPRFLAAIESGRRKPSVKAKLFCPEIAGLFCRIAGLFCHDSRANLSLKPVCFGIAIS